MSTDPIHAAHPLVDHEGPWTEADYLALSPVDGYQGGFIDGDLLMSHQRTVARLPCYLLVEQEPRLELILLRREK